MARALRAAWGCDEVPQIYLWLPRPCTAQMIAMLGPGLLALTVSCLQPVHRQSGDVRNAETDHAADSVPAAGAGREGGLQACGRCTKCRMDARPASQHRECGRGRDDGDKDSDSDGDEQQLSGDAVRDAAARKPRLFHHLEQLSNRTQGLLRAAVTSDPPVP